MLPVRAAVVPGIFGTGLAPDGSLLAAGAVDPHWTLVASADAASPGPDAQVVNNGFPIPPWPAQGPDSQWIAPKADQSSGNAAGAYHYRTSFDLSGFDPASVELRIVLVSDNAVTGVLLNGAGTGLSFTNGFNSWETKFLGSGFVAGLNTLEFIVNNDGSGPTGFRCELLATTTAVEESFELRLQEQGENVAVSWLDLLSCYRLETSTGLDPESWTPVSGTPVREGGRLVLVLPREGEKRFYRLRREETAPPQPVVVVNSHDADASETVLFSENGDTCPTIGCLLNSQLGGRDENRFEALASIDPRVCLKGDPPLSFRWEIFFPPTTNGGQKVTSKGMTGYLTPVLSIQPNSLPEFTAATVDKNWRVKLTITSTVGGEQKQTVARFRFRYAGPLLTISEWLACQNLSEACQFEAAGPTTEPN
jgi:hypothetical protein